MTIEAVTDKIYASMHNNNEDIDLHINALKAELAKAGQKEAVFDPAKLAQNNRQGRKMMESYFKKRGVAISFKAA